MRYCFLTANLLKMKKTIEVASYVMRSEHGDAVPENTGWNKGIWGDHRVYCLMKFYTEFNVFCLYPFRP